MALQQNFGRAIQKLRKKQGLSQEQLGLKAEVDRRYMSDTENGKRNISLDILERLATALQVTVSELMKQAETIDIPILTIDTLKQWLSDNDHEDTIVLDSPSYLNAIIGITEDDRLIYSYNKMIACLMDEDGMSFDDAIEFIEYNTIRTLPYAGEKAPIISYDIEI